MKDVVLVFEDVEMRFRVGAPVVTLVRVDDGGYSSGCGFI